MKIFHEIEKYYHGNPVPERGIINMSEDKQKITLAGIVRCGLTSKYHPPKYLTVILNKIPYGGEQHETYPC